MYCFAAAAATVAVVVAIERRQILCAHTFSLGCHILSSSHYRRLLLLSISSDVRQNNVCISKKSTTTPCMMLRSVILAETGVGRCKESQTFIERAHSRQIVTRLHRFEFRFSL